MNFKFLFLTFDPVLSMLDFYLVKKLKRKPDEINEYDEDKLRKNRKHKLILNKNNRFLLKL